jgi:hypothetical protein
MSSTPQFPAASRTMTPSTSPAAPAFTRTEQATLRALRARYSAGRDLFDSKELAHLHFIRWLYRTGRLAA